MKRLAEQRRLNNNIQSHYVVKKKKTILCIYSQYGIVGLPKIRRKYMENDILEMLMPCLTERLGEALNQDQSYREAIKTEGLLFEQLKNMMSEELVKDMTIDRMENQLKEQKDLLMKYFYAAQISVSIIEKKAYRQGMKDLLELLTVLSKKEDSSSLLERT